MRWLASRRPPSQDSLHNVLEGLKETGSVFAPERCIVATALASFAQMLAKFAHRQSHADVRFVERLTCRPNNVSTRVKAALCELYILGDANVVSVDPLDDPVVGNVCAV